MQERPGLGLPAVLVRREAPSGKSVWQPREVGSRKESSGSCGRNHCHLGGVRKPAGREHGKPWGRQGTRL